MAGGPRDAGRICRDRAPIEAYGKGGFRFGGMSHRGSLLCLPDGIWAWPVDGGRATSTKRRSRRCSPRRRRIDLFLLGTGRRPLGDAGGACADASATLQHRRRGDARPAPAVRTYNILLGEGRRVGAGLIAVD